MTQELLNLWINLSRMLWKLIHMYRHMYNAPHCPQQFINYIWLNYRPQGIKEVLVFAYCVQISDIYYIILSGIWFYWELSFSKYKPLSICSVNVQQICVHISTYFKFPGKGSVQKEIVLFVIKGAKETPKCKGLVLILWMTFYYILIDPFRPKKLNKKKKGNLLAVAFPLSH